MNQINLGPTIQCQGLKKQFYNNMSIPINIDDPKMGLLQNHVYREKLRQDQKVKSS
jgi:hypothetical protein